MIGGEVLQFTKKLTLNQGSDMLGATKNFSFSTEIKNNLASKCEVMQS